MKYQLSQQFCPRSVTRLTLIRRPMRRSESADLPGVPGVPGRRKHTPFRRPSPRTSYDSSCLSGQEGGYRFDAGRCRTGVRSRAAPQWRIATGRCCTLQSNPRTRSDRLGCTQVVQTAATYLTTRTSGFFLFRIHRTGAFQSRMWKAKAN